MSDVASDFGTLVVCTRMSVERADEAIGYYFDRTPTTHERRHFWSYVVFAGWCWYVWALAKEAEGDDAGQDVFTYYRHVTDYVDACCPGTRTVRMRRRRSSRRVRLLTHRTWRVVGDHQ